MPIEIASPALSAIIDPLGAELIHLRDRDGRELMSDGDPDFWTGRAPILFPIVGRLNGDRYRLGDAEYGLPQHGFARRSLFSVVEHDEAHARFRLTDSPATSEAYPFAFVLDLAFSIEAATLSIAATITNPGDAPLPASFGFHPAFAWPLPYGGAREDHRIEFEKGETSDLAGLAPDGWIQGRRPSPVEGDRLRLRDALFADGALIWDRLSSRSVRYGAPGTPSLGITFPDTELLGIWTKPGAAFICIEPWAGLADAKDYAGDFTERPGSFSIAPGESRAFRMTVTLNA